MSLWTGGSNKINTIHLVNTAQGILDSSPKCFISGVGMRVVCVQYSYLALWCACKFTSNRALRNYNKCMSVIHEWWAIIVVPVRKTCKNASPLDGTPSYQQFILSFER